jgi:hypothetical protein
MELEQWGEVAKEAKEFIGKLINPSLEETGQLLGDNIRYWRFKNQVSILIKAKRYLESKGIEPQCIPLKTLVPLLEYGSLEEDENLKAKWAALLANAADSDYQMNMEVGFIDILRQLSPLEASILDSLYNQYLSTSNHSEQLYTQEKILKISGISTKQYHIVVGNFFRLNLLQPFTTADGTVSFDDVEGDFPLALQTTKVLEFTEYGIAFMENCRFTV